MWRISLLFLLMVTLVTCIQPPDYPDIPELELIGLTKDTVMQSSLNEDSIIVVLSFTDGDGNIGSDS